MSGIVIDVEPGAREVMDALRAAGHRAYAVGGCVRDSLLGKVPHDWDITTGARPEQVLALFGERRCIPTGLKHGTVTVRAQDRNGNSFTITAEGFKARALCHEIDHLDGILYIDKTDKKIRRRGE